MMMIFVYKQRHKLCSHENYHATTKFLSFALYFFSFFSSRFTLANAQTFQSRDWNLDPVYTAVTVTIFTFLFLVSYVIFYYCFHWFLRSSRAGPGRQAVRPVEPAPGGLDPSVLKTFPVFVYSDVSGLRPNKGSLECAVCLSPFEGDETLRLLPKCDHVFHLDCVDRWLAGHVTCPLCRATLEPEPDESTSAGPAQVDELGARLGGDDDLNEVGNDTFVGRREIDLEGQIGKHRRWYSTGHVASSGRLEDRERFTLSLPVDVQNDVLARKLNRSRSCILRIEGG